MKEKQKLLDDSHGNPIDCAEAVDGLETRSPNAQRLFHTFPPPLHRPRSECVTVVLPVDRCSERRTVFYSVVLLMGPPQSP